MWKIVPVHPSKHDTGPTFTVIPRNRYMNGFGMGLMTLASLTLTLHLVHRYLYNNNKNRSIFGWWSVLNEIEWALYEAFDFSSFHFYSKAFWLAKQ